MKEDCEIEIMPVKSTCILYLAAIVWHIMMVSYHVFFALFGAGAFDAGEGLGLFIVIAAAMPALASLILPVMNYLGFRAPQASATCRAPRYDARSGATPQATMLGLWRCLTQAVARVPSARR